MTEMLRLAGNWLGLWLVTALLLSVGGALLYPGFRRLCAPCRPAIRSAATLAYGLMGPAAAVLTRVATNGQVTCGTATPCLRRCSGLSSSCSAASSWRKPCAAENMAGSSSGR